tara:strand:+ start:1205 stop:1450 length:246 start_codon:yes stop_codon:yes gene_type:complete
MYPEGWLIEPDGKFLLLFQRDPTSLKRLPKGYVDKWNCANGSPTTFVKRRELSAVDAVSLWITSTEDGWRRVDTQFGEQVA